MVRGDTILEKPKDRLLGTMNIDQQHPWTMIIQWRLTWKWHIKGILYTQCLSFACHWKVFGILMGLSCRNWTSCYTRSPSLVGKQSMYNDDIFRSYIRVRGAWVYQLLQFFHSCGTSVLSCIERILEAIQGCIMYIHIYIQYLYIYIPFKIFNGTPNCSLPFFKR